MEFLSTIPEECHLPFELITVIYDNCDSITRTVFLYVCRSFRVRPAIRYYNLYHAVITSGDVYTPLLPWIKDLHYPVKSSSYIIAARRGHLAVIEYLDLTTLSDRKKEKMMLEAAKYGRVDIVDYLYKNDVGRRWNRLLLPIPSPDIVHNGHLNVLEWSRIHSSPTLWLSRLLDVDLEKVIANGHYEMFKYLLAIDDPEHRFQWDDSYLPLIAKIGNLEFLQHYWCRRSLVPQFGSTRVVMSLPSSQGTYIRYTERLPSSRITVALPERLPSSIRSEIREASVDPRPTTAITTEGRSNTLQGPTRRQQPSTRLPPTPARRPTSNITDSTSSATQLYNKYDEDVCVNAVKSGNLPLLKWVLENVTNVPKELLVTSKTGIPMTIQLDDNGLQFIQYLLSLRPITSEYVRRIYSAIISGLDRQYRRQTINYESYLQVFNYLLSLDEDVIHMEECSDCLYLLVDGGHTPIIRWLFEHGYTYVDEEEECRMCLEALLAPISSENKIELLELLMANGYPSDGDWYTVLCDLQDVTLADWLLARDGIDSLIVAIDNTDNLIEPPLEVENLKVLDWLYTHHLEFFIELEPLIIKQGGILLRWFIHRSNANQRSLHSLLGGILDNPDDCDYDSILSSIKLLYRYGCKIDHEFWKICYKNELITLLDWILDTGYLPEDDMIDDYLILRNCMSWKSIR